MANEKEADKLLDKMAGEITAAVPPEAVATRIYMDGGELILNVVTAKDLYKSDQK